MDYLHAVFDWGEEYSIGIMEVVSMEIKVTGRDVFSGVRDTFAKTGSIEVKKRSEFLDNDFLRDAVSINKRQEERLNSLKKVKELMEDLRNTDVIKDKNTLSKFNINILRNDAGIGVKIEDAEQLKKETLTVSVKRLPTEAVVASDEISEKGKIGFSGVIEVNGVQIVVSKDDTTGNLIEKINKGEDLNTNLRLDTGEDLNLDKELIKGQDTKATGAYSDGRLTISSKDTGEDAYINIDGNTKILKESLGLVGDDGELKNIVQRGAAGEININGASVTVNDREITVNGIRIDLSNAEEGKESIVEINYDDTAVTSKLKTFQDKFNSLIGYLNNVLAKEDGDIKDIKNKVYIQGNKEAGIEVQKRSFYDTLINAKSSLGSIINESLKSGGMMLDKEGTVSFDLEKIKQNIDSIRENFKNDENSTIFTKLGKDIAPYFEKLSPLNIKEEVASKALEGLNAKYDKKTKIEEIQEENKKINAKIKALAEELNIDTKIVFGSKRKEKIDKDKEEKDKLNWKPKS